jgi:hypothetical protein
MISRGIPEKAAQFVPYDDSERPGWNLREWTCGSSLVEKHYFIGLALCCVGETDFHVRILKMRRFVDETTSKDFLSAPVR